jgi:hypothetical protein
MLLVLCCLACGACTTAPADAAGSYLTIVTQGLDGAVQTRVEPYVPRAGDIVLFDDHSPTWLFLYKMVGSGMPDHAGIVFTLPDGRAALLEAAPDDGKLAGMYVRLVEAMPRLHQFVAQIHGTIYIRRLKCPLSPEQSARLTDFALAQEGKRYALGRLLLQATPCRCRSGMRAQLFGKTYLDRCSWLCAELVVAAGTAVGLFNPNVHHANRIYPLDLFDDRVYPDLGQTWYPSALWSPTPEPAVTGSK